MACGLHSTFPKKVRWYSVTAGFGVMLAEIWILGQFGYELNSGYITCAVLLVGYVFSYYLVSAAICRTYRSLVPSYMQP